MDSAERERLDALERRITALEQAVRARAQRDVAPAQPPQPPRPPIPTPPSGAPISLQNLLPNVDLESLVGRYGTLVLATVSALAAVGTFLGWAIANGLLGPAQRIALGLIVAIGLGVAGLRLRRRERSFGASLLGLALAIAHVCAWGAGPSLKLVPEWGAFIFAAVAAIALAIFAHAEADEPLWSVGFSGAAIAPFVTSSGRGNLFLLSAYGLAVMTASGYAMGGKRWIVAGRLFLLAAALYVAALATGFEMDFGPLLATWFPLALAVTAVIPWTRGMSRTERLRALGTLAGVAALRTGIGMASPLTHRATGALLAAAGVVWLVLVDRTHTEHVDAPAGARRLHEGDWLDGGVLPLAFISAAVMAFDASARGTGIAMSVASGVMLIAVMRFPRGSVRDASVFATIICALIAALLLERSHPLLITATIAALGAVCMIANLAWPSISWSTLALVGFTWAILATLAHLAARAPYAYSPFATTASAVSLAVLAALGIAWRCARDAGIERVLRAAVVVWAFVWVHQEIVAAYSPTIAILLRVSYYAITSVLAVGIGRARGAAILRHAGLGLAILAAATALYGARNIDAIAARIGADLVAAVFLLAIAYWYRRPGGSLEPVAASVTSPVPAPDSQPPTPASRLRGPTSPASPSGR
ncbi:MAG TPA: DUF2339 domain-containing protein [Gemmatimonadaceae bacterium]|nr:DUF2339 domain-containing protein [Gemmatimonadaceae bacterium]